MARDDDAELLLLLHRAADAARRALDGLADWGLAGTSDGQHHSDIAADEAVLTVLSNAGLSVLSEESGVCPTGGELLAVVDPLDGSTNAAHGIPWYATSICILDPGGPRVSLVADQASGRRFEAARGRGARVDGTPLRPSRCTSLSDSVVGLSGFPRRALGWRQYRALGAVALDLCAVAEGVLDGYVDCSDSAHGPWDYLGALLVCREAGARVDDALGRDLVVREHSARRTPVAAGTPELLTQLLDARRAVGRAAGRL